MNDVFVGIEERLVKKILQVMADKSTSSGCVIKENLNYLLSSWCSSNSIFKFPYIFLDCKSESEFTQHYGKQIFPILIRENKINDIHQLIDNMEIPFEDLFNNSCSFIIPWALIDKSQEAKELVNDNKIFNKNIGQFSSLLLENIEKVIIQMGNVSN